MSSAETIQIPGMKSTTVLRQHWCQILITSTVSTTRNTIRPFQQEWIKMGQCTEAIPINTIISQLNLALTTQPHCLQTRRVPRLQICYTGSKACINNSRPVSSYNTSLITLPLHLSKMMFSPHRQITVLQICFCEVSILATFSRLMKRRRHGVKHQPLIKTAFSSLP